MQEALLAAARAVARRGRPGQPARLADHGRVPAADRPAPQRATPAAGARTPIAARDVARRADEPSARPTHDDTLTLLFLCCHPALSPPSQLALTLRAVGGLTTAEIAHAFLVPEATMAQRISRAKQTIRAAGATFRLPPDDERADRLRVVLHVLYLDLQRGLHGVVGRRPRSGPT